MENKEIIEKIKNIATSINYQVETINALLQVLIARDLIQDSDEVYYFGFNVIDTQNLMRETIHKMDKTEIMLNSDNLIEFDAAAMEENAREHPSNV